MLVSLSALLRMPLRLLYTTYISTCVFTYFSIYTYICACNYVFTSILNLNSTHSYLHHHTCISDMHSLMFICMYLDRSTHTCINHFIKTNAKSYAKSYKTNTMKTNKQYDGIVSVTLLSHSYLYKYHNHNRCKIERLAQKMSIKYSPK